MIDRLIRYRMVSSVKYLGINKVLLMVILAVHLTACGGGGGGGSGGSGTADIAGDVSISGSLGDGPITGAAIVVYSGDRNELGTMTSDRNRLLSIDYQGQESVIIRWIIQGHGWI